MRRGVEPRVMNYSILSSVPFATLKWASWTNRRSFTFSMYCQVLLEYLHFDSTDSTCEFLLLPCTGASVFSDVYSDIYIWRNCTEYKNETCNYFSISDESYNKIDISYTQSKNFDHQEIYKEFPMSNILSYKIC